MKKAEQGITSDRYAVIPRTLIFVTRGDDVLLIKGAPTKRLWANLYNGIGGHIERREDALSAAIRELNEETGLVGVYLCLFGTVFIDVSEELGIGLFIFRGEYSGGTLVDSSEGQLEWIPINRLEEYPLVEDLKTLLPLILRMRPGDPPFSALYDYDEQERMRIHIGGTS
jgi:8-oxo-dGTP diphosphatase